MISFFPPTNIKLLGENKSATRYYEHMKHRIQISVDEFIFHFLQTSLNYCDKRTVGFEDLILVQ